MHLYRLLTATAAAALVAGVGYAQTSAGQTSAGQTGAAEKGTPNIAAPPAAKGDIVETAKAAGTFNTFLKAVEATNLTSVLKTSKNLTVFAPTDEAFASLPAGELEKMMLPENRAALQKLMTYHIINARVDSTKLKGAKGALPTVAGASVELDGSGQGLTVNDADIIKPDLLASNGVIHVVDKVLKPGAPSASASGAAASTTAASAATDEPEEEPAKSPK